MIYWRNSFTKIGGDKFNKQYAYNVRHNYGKEGKRIDYTPYSCNKIISSSPNNGDYHGCPYKIFDSQNLRKYLAINKKMGTQDIDIILDLVKNNHYQLACRSYFGHQHKDIMKRKNIAIEDLNSNWSHPNEYFDHSWKIYHGDKKEEEKKDMEQDDDVMMNNNNNNNNNNSGNNYNQNNKENNFIQNRNMNNNGMTPGNNSSNNQQQRQPVNKSTNRFAANSSMNIDG